MSKKRASPESTNDEQTEEVSDSVFQQHDDAKRAKLISFSETTLQDLPMELIECVLIKAVAKEVERMGLAKRAWKEKVDLVINRLCTVCSQWSHILTSNFFRNELHRTLDRTAEKTIRLEILHQSPIPSYVYSITTMKDEIIMLCSPPSDDSFSTVYDFLNVYDRENLAEVKDVISLPGINAEQVTACSVSNCVYLLDRETFNYIRITRITKKDEHQFNVAPFITVPWASLPMPILSVAANGSIIFSRRNYEGDQVIGIYSPNGFLQHEMKLWWHFYPKFCDIIPKPNGNLVLVSYKSESLKTLTEIDMEVNSKHIRQYESSCYVPKYIFNSVNHVDAYGRILLIGLRKRFELVDSEFNLLKFSGPQLNAENFIYNAARNEAVAIERDDARQHAVLTIFRFSEE